MIYARQSTAIIVTVGPVLDADGVAVTDGVVGDFKISKNGGAPAALNGSATLTHRHTGFYSLSLTATDVNTVGTAEVVIDDTVNACPMKEITVIEPAVYDAFFADTATGVPALAALEATSQSIKTKTDFLPSATAGAAGGVLIAGSNAATTFATLTVTGAVAFQSTFAVTTSTSLAALSATTITASGTTSLAAVTTSGTVTLNALTVTNNVLVSGNFTVTGTTTHTGAFTATNASNDIRGISVTATGLNLVLSSSTFTQAVVDAVWDEAIAGHVGAGSTGAALNAAGTAGDPWTTDLSTYTTPGTAGFIVASLDGLQVANLNALLAPLTNFANDYGSGLLATDINGKVLGSGGGTIVGVGAWALDGAGAAIAPAATALSNAVWTNAKAAFVDVAISSRLATTSYTTPPTAVANADALLGRNVAGGSSTGRVVSEALYAIRNKVAIVTNTMTVFGTDDTTPSWTSTLTTDAAAEPIVSSDPV